MLDFIKTCLSDYSEIISGLVVVITGVVTIRKALKSGFKDRDKELVKKIDDLDESMKKANEKQNAENEKRFLKIEKTLDLNEKDRLRQEIFRYGNICRRGNFISGEEFIYLREKIVAKYKALGGNDIGDDEWNFIQECYRKQQSKK